MRQTNKNIIWIQGTLLNDPFDTLGGFGAKRHPDRLRQRHGFFLQASVEQLAKYLASRHGIAYRRAFCTRVLSQSEKLPIAVSNIANETIWLFGSGGEGGIAAQA